MPIRDLPSPLRDVFFTLCVEGIGTLGKEVIDLEARESVLGNLLLDGGRLLPGRGDHQATRARGKLELVGDEAVRGLNIEPPSREREE